MLNTSKLERRRRGWNQNEYVISYQAIENSRFGENLL